MKNFKEKWEIQQNWQLIFPFFGLIGLIYSGFKISNDFLAEDHIMGEGLEKIKIY